ncbi:MAG: alpha/beta hydrolase [Pseudomonadales bacterium]|nr:alpha/beta hydrolase [Pseudomonadales bacterium]
MANEFSSEFFEVNDLKLHYRFRDGEGTPLLFFHATGFHSRVWFQVVESMGNPIYLVDAPGHGKSDRPGELFYWDKVAQMMAALVEHLDLNEVFGIGHSMGGQLMLSVASIMPQRFTQLLLLDPVVASLELIKTFQAIVDSPIARRRNDWESSEAFYKAYLERDPYNTWNKTVFKDYADGALKPVENSERFQLACEPDLEACVYRNLGAEPLLEKLADINVPVHIIRAREFGPEDEKFSFRYSPTWPELVNKLPNATEDHRRDVDHFFPMEFPEMIAEEMAKLQS